MHIVWFIVKYKTSQASYKATDPTPCSTVDQFYPNCVSFEWSDVDPSSQRTTILCLIELAIDDEFRSAHRYQTKCTGFWMVILKRRPRPTALLYWYNIMRTQPPHVQQYNVMYSTKDTHSLPKLHDIVGIWLGGFLLRSRIPKSMLLATKVSTTDPSIANVIKTTKQAYSVSTFMFTV